jgi:hypothetical protein
MSRLSFGFLASAAVVALLMASVQVQLTETASAQTETLDDPNAHSGH